MPPIAIVGLGNPGSEYVGTRHNAGFWLVDKLVHRMNAAWKDKSRFHARVALVSAWGETLVLIKPTTFMNCSGEYLKPLLNYHKCILAETIVVHDDVAFPPGHVKLSRNRGDGGHNGVKDMIRAIGPNFIRFRLGVGAKQDFQMDLADHVLGRLRPEEIRDLEGNLDFFLDTLREIVDKGCAHAMNSVNQTNKVRSETDEQTKLQGDDGS